MQNTFRFHWINRTAWRSFFSAAAAAVAGVLLVAPPFAWWRFFAAAAVVAGVYGVALRGTGRGARAFWVLIGLVGAVAAVLFSTALAPLVVVSRGAYVLLLGLFAFAFAGDARALFGAGRAASGVLGALLVFSSAFFYFALFVPLVSLPPFLFLLVLGLFLALTLLASETFAVAGGFPRRAALVGGGVVGLFGVEVAFLLTFLSLGPLALALLFSFIVFSVVLAAGAAGQGKFSPNLAIRGVICLLALAALVLAFLG
ncbi:MAG: hypothetical protein V1656_03040 [Candidatus Jorgensenbacteria bacterium]